MRHWLNLGAILFHRMSFQTIKVPDGVVPIGSDDGIHLNVTPSRLAAGVIAGVVVGGLALLVLAGAGGWFLWRKRKEHKNAYFYNSVKPDLTGNESSLMVCYFG